MKLNIFITTLAIVLCSSVMAHSKPAACPSPSAIQVEGLKSGGHYTEHDLWIIVDGSEHQYDTKDQWTFAVSEIPAKNSREAYQKALDSLVSLTFSNGPVSVGLDDVERYACMYKTAEGYSAWTITPPWSGF